MKKNKDFLIELLTEELPPNALLRLAQVFCEQVKQRLEAAALQFHQIQFFATPRRLALLVSELQDQEADYWVERRGPALKAAYDEEGEPTKALVGFMRSCGITREALMTLKTEQGEWVGAKQKIIGKKINEFMPSIIDAALKSLPIPKRMRWGEGLAEFVRPIHSVVMLYGTEVIDAMILGIKTGRMTRGHRFLTIKAIPIKKAADYAVLLAKKGYVIADFVARRERIRKGANDSVQEKLAGKGSVYIASEDFLNEVTGLVEWPVALCGRFDTHFLSLPKEVLIASMQAHQRYFPVIDQGNHLLPYFVTIANIKSKEPLRVIHGNERVLRARLADAAFFYAEDQKESLDDRVEKLKGIIFQHRLGTLYDKALRLSRLASDIAAQMNADVKEAARAGWLAKADLTTNMVNEFPELQGVMGFYYAKEGESKAVAGALKEQYLPRFAGDQIPKTQLGMILAMADRLDTLVGAFGINQIPTGDKDPYGLRRAALGVLRILIEGHISLDLRSLIENAIQTYSLPLNLDVLKLLTFMQERLRIWYQEDQGVPADIFASVAALSITDPLDLHKRIQAVRAFKQLSESQALSIANKRVSNILTKCEIATSAKEIDPAYFENESEKSLAKQLEEKSHVIERLWKKAQYEAVLMQLAELRHPIDDFFDHVMVMTEDKPRRENRLLILRKLRKLFLYVADIALLQ